MMPRTQSVCNPAQFLGCETGPAATVTVNADVPRQERAISRVEPVLARVFRCEVGTASARAALLAGRLLVVVIALRRLFEGRIVRIALRGDRTGWRSHGRRRSRM